MNINLLYDFSVDRENQIIHITREFNAGPELVWQAWTTARLLDQWCAPNPYRTETKVLDLRQGGIWQYAIVSPEGQKHWSRHDYQHIETRKSMTELRAFCDEGGQVVPGFLPTEATTTFEEAEAGTRVTIHERYGSQEIFEKMATETHKKGFSSHLKNLDRLLLTLQAG
ncbi:ATPase [Pedobacter yulinensis]|uniref:ATPase n=1 Tax=Pedobacter yulinensis TaxID=2126353 RepID=A0A2T3HL37_9SPHI|nr:SRPBCC domain-containing protein [Pedobacter yulinensis]PST83101.1 ATPase [Pedobacter yulinensis]